MAISSRSATLLIAIALFFVSLAEAQTWTACNPLNRTDCALDDALGTSVAFNFTQFTANVKLWNTTSGTIGYNEDDKGADFVIHGEGDSPTIQSNFYIFFGVVSVIVKAATGVGVVSSVVLQSDDLDEVDWEWIGGNSTHVETNYFGKGDTSTYDRAIWYPVSDPQVQTHNYTTVWTAESIQWMIDNNVVRTLKYEDAKGGTRFPQTPMIVKIGNWVGGDPAHNSNGTVEWAGGIADYKTAPWTMSVESVYIQDFSQGKEYKYGDTSGTWQSIQVINGTSSAAAYINAPHTVPQHWRALPQGVRIAIICSSLGVAAAFALTITFCCIKQRRAGRKEKAGEDSNWSKEQAEFVEFQSKKDNSHHYAMAGKV